MLRNVLTERDKYTNITFAAEDEVLQSIRLALRSDGLEGVNVGPNEGQILLTLLQMVNANRVLEIGTLYGYSTTWLARGLSKSGRLTTLEKEPRHYEKAKELLKSIPEYAQIDFRLGDAEKILEEITESFDVIFIDANKAAYGNYLQWAMTHVRSGGLIIGDNTFLFGHVYGEGQEENMSEKTIETMRQFNLQLAKSKQFRTMMIPTAEGMTVALKIV